MSLAELVRRRKVRRWLALAAAAVAVYGVVGSLAVPPLLRSLLSDKLTKALHRRTTVAGVSVNPFALSVRVRGLVVREPSSEEVFLSLGELYANLKLASAFRLAPVLEELRLGDLHAHLVRNPDSTYNVSDLIAPASPPTPGPARPLRYALNNIQITGGSIDFDDRPTGKVHSVRNLYVGIPFLSSLPDETEVFVQPALRAVVNGTLVAVGGRTKPFSGSRETSLDIDLRDLDIPTYLAYLPVSLRFKVPSALLTTRLTLTFSQERGKASTLLLSGRASLRDVRITDSRGDELLGLPLLDVHIGAADLLARHTRLERVLLQQPRLRVARDAARAWNLGVLAPAPTGGGEAGDAGGAFGLEVDQLVVADANVSFADATMSPPFEAVIRPLELDVRGFSTAPGAAATAALSLVTDAGETLRERGELTYAPLTVHGTVEVAGAPLGRYEPYYRNAVAFEVAEGVLGFSTAFAWSGSSDSWTFSGLVATLRSLRLHRGGEHGDFLTVRELALKGSSLDLARRDLTLGELSVAGARLAVARGADGTWNLASLLPPSPAASAEAAGSAPRPAPPPAWTVAVGRLAIERAAVEVDDALPVRPVHVVLAPLAVTAMNLTTAGGGKGRVKISSGLNGSGRVSLAGELALAPFVAKLAADVKSVPLVPLQGYITDRVHLVVSDGTASASGELSVAAGGTAPAASFIGRASIDRLATVDEGAAEDLLRWDSLAFDGVTFASDPFSLEIAEVALTGLTSTVIVAADGTINLKRVMGGAPAAPASENEAEEAAGGEAAAPTPTSAAPAAAPVPTAMTPEAGATEAVRIGAVTLRNGSVVLIDRSVSPEFRMNVTDLAGSVSGLSSLASTAATVDVHATLNGQAPVSVSGRVNPLAGSLFLDLRVVGRGFDLPPVSPYSGTYAGYAIQRGKLDVDLGYKIAGRRLDAQNKLFLDQFDFGEKVASAKATHLPVRLAVSVLKDRDGRITLDLPVSGSLDDPKFRVGRIILRMVVNLLAKVATSPFALLGSMFGGSSAELDTVVFAPGAATLNDAARGRLDTLAKVLYDRPGLRLEIAGRTDETADREGLRRTGLERAIKREKLDGLVRRGGTAPSIDAVTVAPDEYGRYLKLAYKHAKIAKPRSFLGIAKAEPVAEMERLLLANLDPSPDDLRHLAAARAEAVQSYLLQTGMVKPDQLFIVGTAGGVFAQGEKGPATRVDLSLK